MAAIACGSVWVEENMPSKVILWSSQRATTLLGRGIGGSRVSES